MEYDINISTPIKRKQLCEQVMKLPGAPGGKLWVGRRSSKRCFSLKFLLEDMDAALAAKQKEINAADKT